MGVGGRYSGEGHHTNLSDVGRVTLLLFITFGEGHLPFKKHFLPYCHFPIHYPINARNGVFTHSTPLPNPFNFSRMFSLVRCLPFIEEINRSRLGLKIQFQQFRSPFIFYLATFNCTSPLYVSIVNIKCARAERVGSDTKFFFIEML